MIPGQCHALSVHLFCDSHAAKALVIEELVNPPASLETGVGPATPPGSDPLNTERHRPISDLFAITVIEYTILLFSSIHSFIHTVFLWSENFIILNTSILSYFYAIIESL